MKWLYKISLIVLFASHGVSAQNILQEALNAYKGGDLSKAKVEILKAENDDALKEDPTTWYLKGFIFKDIYKSDTQNDANFMTRFEAVVAFERLKKMAGAEKYEGDVNKNLKYLASTFYNDAIKLLESKEFDSSQKGYDYFHKAMQLSGEPQSSIDERELNYYMGKASALNNLHKQDTTGELRYFEQTIDTYKYVLNKDSLNTKVNYNLAVVYYNEAVNIINKLDYDEVDLISFNEIEDQSIEYFKLSLPFMHRVHELQPDNKNAIEGLAGIYFGLRDFDKSNHFKDLLKK